MKTALRGLIAAITLLISPLLIAASYLEHPDVTGSAHYTGRTGMARLSPVSSTQWLQRHQHSAMNLGIGNQGFVLENLQLSALIYDIANKLLLQWPGTVPALAIFIQGDRSPLSYGAATTHAREIFINYGVLLHAESEDELAAVIGHELSHILLEHDKTLDYKKKMHGTVTVLGQARDLYASADALSYNQDSRRLVLDSSASDALKQSAMQQMVAKQLYDSVHASLFSRDNEYDADRLAMDLLVGAGYAPMGLKMSLERMAHSYELSSDIANQFSENSRKLLQQQSLHLNKLANRRQQGEYDYRASLKRLQHELSDSSLDIGKQSMIKWTSRSHPVPEKRVEQITAYLYDNFPRAVRRRRPSRQSAQRFKSGPIAEQLAHYQAANETLEAIALGKPAIAAQRAQLAISAPTANEPYSRYIVFFQRRAQGDRHAADILRDLDQSGFVPIYASVTIADALANAGALQPALATATGTESRYGTIPGFYPVKIKQALSSGSRAQVEQLAHACFDATPGNDALGDRCAKLSGVSQPGIAEQGVPGAINKIGKSLFGGNNPLFGSGK